MKVIRQILASPLLLLALGFSALAYWIYGEGFAEQVMKMHSDIHKFFNIHHE